MMLFAITFLAAFGLAASLGLLLFGRDVGMGRLSSLVGTRDKSPVRHLRSLIHPRQSSVETIVKPFQNLLPRSPAEGSVIQKRLPRAGARQRRGRESGAGG